jgi:diguanylate cyclase (GGDEF)-like protein/PAS domain S-box-containing protein
MYEIEKAHKKEVILVVDDDPFIRTRYKNILEDAGFEAVTVSDGESAIAGFSDLGPALILLDLAMPGKDGFTTCREIRAIAEGKYTPILMLTGLDDAESIHESFDAGATDFISKDVKPELLVYRLRYMLRNSQNVKDLAESEARLANAQRLARLGYWEWHPLSGTFRGSAELFRMLGFEQSTPFCSFENFLATIESRDRATVRCGLDDAFRNTSMYSCECRIERPDSTLLVVHLQGNADGTAHGKIPFMTGTIQDISESRMAEEDLKLLRDAVECLPIGLTISDLHGKIIYTNPSEAKTHGYTTQELIGQNAGQFAATHRRKPVSPKRLQDIGIWQRESINIRKNGEEFPVRLTSMSVTNLEGNFLGIVTTCEDITTLKNAEQKIHRLAYYDPLTGLPNRRLFLDRLHQALASAKRDETRIGLFFIDLDNFKDINDTQGHDSGDKLLQEVAHRLMHTMRECDTIARIGGDEFVIVLTSVTSQETTAHAAERVLSIFSHSFDIQERQIFCSASIGIAHYPEDGTDTESLYKCADIAMYHAKKEGRSRYRFFSEKMNHKIMHRIALEQSLRRGFEKQEFFLLYQPQWELKTERMTGVEALLRWQNADHALLSPSVFIPIAEENGMIFDLGEWVLRTACNQARSWELAGHRGLKMAVNISGMQLKQPDFLKMIERVLYETGADPLGLEFEFTESVFMGPTEKIIENLMDLKKMGIQLSIDDFGMGYSSLNYLKNFPVDRIKIDRSFIADIGNIDDDAPIVEAIIAMASSLKHRVIAEGVENIDQIQKLLKLGCDEVQGFYLSAPMTAEDVIKRLESSYHPGLP